MRRSGTLTEIYFNQQQPMAKMTDSNSTPTHEQIAQRAYDIFVERGQPEGQDLAHWLEAERQLRASGKPSSTTTATANAPAASTPIRPQGNGRAQQGNGGRTQSRAAVRK
jgi:hypothetical protein